MTPFKAGAGALPPFMKGAMVPLPRFETCVHRFEKKEGGSLRQGFTMWLYTEKEEGRAMGCSVPVGVWGGGGGGGGGIWFRLRKV